jgi:hypothetical protein
MNSVFALLLLQTGSPWEIVVGGLMFAFGEGGSKRMFSGIIFGVGMSIAAVNFLSWLFPGA